VYTLHKTINHLFEREYDDSFMLRDGYKSLIVPNQNHSELKNGEVFLGYFSLQVVEGLNVKKFIRLGNKNKIQEVPLFVMQLYIMRKKIRIRPSEYLYNLLK